MSNGKRRDKGRDDDMSKTGVTRFNLKAGIAAAALAMFAQGVPAQAQVQTYSFDIPSQDLGAALKAFARASRQQVTFDAKAVRGKRSPALKGNYPARAALDALLQGSGLEVEQGRSGLFIIKPATQAVAAGATRPDRVASEGSDGSLTEVRNEIVVTGSRIPTKVGNGAQDVKVYNREQIDRSGQTTVTDFLNTLPGASLGRSETAVQSAGGATSVQLRGLPLGTTLILLNGRRVETSGSQAGDDFFDLNNIPLAAVERIEVLADGSSAVYGSDAIAGVVNIILKTDFNGVQAEAKYGHANGLDEASASIALGKTFEHGSFSILGSYQRRSTLLTDERAVTKSPPGAQYNMCDLADVYSPTGFPGAPGATYAALTAAPASGAPSLSSFNYNSLNKCSIYEHVSTIPKTERVGLLASGEYEISPNVTAFAEVMYSHNRQELSAGDQGLFGISVLQLFSMGAGNPYNPFGQKVGISVNLPSVKSASIDKTSFFRPLVGMRGSLGSSWHWEVSAWAAIDRTTRTEPDTYQNSAAIQAALNATTPSTALNIFNQSGADQQALLKTFFYDGLTKFRGSTESVNGFIQGPLFKLPAGDLVVVLGGEFDRSTVEQNVIVDPNNPVGQSTYKRSNLAIFGEARVPILPPLSSTTTQTLLAATLAARYDHYSDAGDVFTPQLGVELRPASSLLLRGTYSKSFKAPPLTSLLTPTTSGIVFADDPVTGELAGFTNISGGNPNLKPQKGSSYSFGGVYTPRIGANKMTIGVTYWKLKEEDVIQSQAAGFILENSASFPGRVVRDAAGNVVSVDVTALNFGAIEVSGIDYSISYLIQTGIGDFRPSIGATQTLSYTSALVPDAPPVDGLAKAQSSGNWAPRWKGMIALNWKKGRYSIGADARYVSKYSDYDGGRSIGNFWIADFNARANLFGTAGAHSTPVFIEVGASNVFNQLPQASNFYQGLLGYDPTQSDIRGRYTYVRLGTNF
ncbi:MAG: TonB-dependent receptor [Sphingomonas sp.]